MEYWHISLPADGLRITIKIYWFLLNCHFKKCKAFQACESPDAGTLGRSRDLDPTNTGFPVAWPHLTSHAELALPHYFYGVVRCKCPAWAPSRAPRRLISGWRQCSCYTAACACVLFQHQVNVIPTTVFHNQVEKFLKCFIYKVNKQLQKWLHILYDFSLFFCFCLSVGSAKVSFL